MADRSVAVRLRLITTEWTAGTAAAGASMKKLTHDMDEAARTGKKGMSELSTGAAVAGGAILLGVGFAVKAFMDFDKQMSATAAASGATGKQLEALKASALEAGAATKYSATEAAAGQEALAKAGVSAADIVGGALTGALNLAASGNMSVADSAEVAASAMTTFGLKGKDVSHVADLIAAGAGKAQGEVSDMGFALRQSSAVAAQMGLSIEDTTGALAMFASAGLTGSDAGTSFKQMLLSLIPNSEKAAKEMEEYGLSFFDASGNVKSFSEIAGELQSKLGGLTKEQQAATLKTLFGADAYRVASVAMEQGAKGATEWRNKVNDAGYAADQAAKKMDNLAGDLEKLRGSIETGLIQTGSGANGALRTLTQGVDGLVNSYLNLPGPLQQTVFWLAAGTGAALGGAGAYGTLAPKIQIATDAMDAMGPAGRRASGALIGLGKAAGYATAVVVMAEGANMLAEAFADVPPSVDQLAASLRSFSLHGRATGAAARVLGKDLSVLGDAKALTDDGMWSKARRGLASWADQAGVAGGAAGALGMGLSQSEKAFKQVDTALAQMVGSGKVGDAAATYDLLAAAAIRQGMSVEDLNRLLPQYTGSLGETGEVAGTAAGSTGELAGKTGEVQQAAQMAAEAVKAFKDELEGLNSGNIAADQTAIAFKDSLVEMRDALEESGGKTSLLSGKTGEARMALIEAAQAASEHAQAVVDQTQDVDAGTNALARARAELIANAVRSGMARSEAQKLADRYLSMPKSVSTSVSTPGLQQSLVGIANLRRALNTIDNRVVTSYIRHVVIGEGNAVGPNTSLGGVLKRGSSRADGGIDIVRAANGYLPKTATIMPPGDTLYAWRERETQGEAFIPLADSKRTRSKQIAEDVVAMFGGSVAWSNGGMAVSTTTTTAPAHTPGRVVAELSPRAEAAITALAGRVVQVELRVDSEVLARANTAGQRKISHRG